MAMSIKDLLAEACEIPSKNPKLAVFVLIICLIPSLLLYFVQYILLMFFFAKQVDQIMANVVALASTHGADYESLIPRMMEDAKVLMIYLVITLIVTILIPVFQSIIVIYWVDMTRFQKQVAPKDFVIKVSKTWKRTLITILLINALLLCCSVVWVCVFATAKAVFGPSMLWGLSLVVIAILALASFIFAIVVANLAGVISVIEDGCYGFGAIDKAMDILKGRMMQGCLLTLAIFGTSFSIFFLFRLLSAMLEKEGMLSFVLGLVQVSLAQMMAMFNMEVFTVFYRDCQDSHDGFAGLEIHYTKLPTEV